ncbi:LysE family translocator [Balneatrix alpica]|uniref:LysE family translocator n=1 Tax=Balneatrix alpica TaxID=75684 RepID=UPI0027399BE9|nr:LysE family translocator [Balneatrix alpica]
MTLTTLALFIPACFALNMAPGPNNLLALHNGKCHGIGQACYAGIGRLLAFALMISLAATGLATLLYASERLFLVIKLAGGLYLLWLAYQLWRAPIEIAAPQTEASAATLGRLIRQEFYLAAGNPKAILIFTAFLPQFVDPNGPVASQFVTLGSLFLLLEALALLIYAYFGAVLAHWFDSPASRRLFNRGSAALLGSAGVGLLLARRD